MKGIRVWRGPFRVWVDGVPQTTMLTDGFVSGRAGNLFFPVFSILPTHGPFILRTFSLTKSSFIIIVLMIIEVEKYVLCSK